MRFSDMYGLKENEGSICLILPHRTLPDGDDLAKVQLIVVDLSDKDGCHGLI